MRARLAQHGITPASDNGVLWNFEKFVITRGGRVAARFSPDIEAEDFRLLWVLDGALTADAF